MNHAPAVQYPVGCSVWARRCLVVLITLWVLAQGLWLLALDGQAWPGAWWVSMLVGLLGLAGVLWQARHPLLGELHWQPAATAEALRGQAAEWHWFSAAYRHGTELASLERALDGQRFMLLRARTRAGLTLWLWLEAQAEPRDWDALRRAVRAHRRVVDHRV